MCVPGVGVFGYNTVLVAISLYNCLNKYPGPEGGSGEEMED